MHVLWGKVISKVGTEADLVSRNLWGNSRREHIQSMSYIYRAYSAIPSYKFPVRTEHDLGFSLEA